MARKRRENEDREQPEREEPTEDEGKQEPRRRRPKLGNPDADPVKIHRQYVEERLGGGDPATPEAYEEALRQWQEIPGAVSRPPTEVPRPPEPPPRREEDEDTDTESSQ